MRYLTLKNILKNRILQLTLPFIILVAVIYLAIFAILIPSLRKFAYDKRKSELKNAVTLAVSELEFYAKMQHDHFFTKNFAQKAAMDHIAQLRFGKNNQDYFWIIDIDGRLIEHPYREKMIGLNHADLMAPDGTYFVRNFIKKATKDGGGFVEYEWYKEGKSGETVSKLAALSLFKEWGWIIGTDLPVDDINKDISNIMKATLAGTFIITFLIGLLYIFILGKLLKQEKERAKIFKRLAEKDAKITALFDAVPDMILRLHKDGTVLDYKEPLNFEPFLDPVLILDAMISDVLPANIAKKMSNSMSLAFETMKPQILVFDFKLSDKKKIKIESHFVVSDKEEVLATFRDVTGRG